MPYPSFHNPFREHAWPRTVGGFGLIELLVTISIMLLVTSVILARHSSFNSAILLRNQAYSVAFSVREAQQQAVSVVGSEANFRVAYGVHFAQAQREYPTFRDANANDFYDSVGDPVMMPGRLDQRFEIRRILVGNVATTNPLSVTFVRPNFDARFKESASGALSNVDEVEIVIGLVGSATAERSVIITSTGQITVK